MNNDVRVVERPGAPELPTLELNAAVRRVMAVACSTSVAFAAVSREQPDVLAARSRGAPRSSGFVNVAWRRRRPCVPARIRRFCLRGRRRGIGLRSGRRPRFDASAARGVEWLHVDYEASLEPFYRKAGFRPTPAGLMRLSKSSKGNGPDESPARSCVSSGLKPGAWSLEPALLARFLQRRLAAARGLGSGDDLGLRRVRHFLVVRVLHVIRAAAAGG